MWGNVKNLTNHFVAECFQNETKPWKTFHCANNAFRFWNFCTFIQQNNFKVEGYCGFVDYQNHQSLFFKMFFLYLSFMSSSWNFLDKFLSGCDLDTVEQKFLALRNFVFQDKGIHFGLASFRIQNGLKTRLRFSCVNQGLGLCASMFFWDWAKAHSGMFSKHSVS